MENINDDDDVVVMKQTSADMYPTTASFSTTGRELDPTSLSNYMQKQVFGPKDAVDCKIKNANESCVRVSAQPNSSLLTAKLDNENKNAGNFDDVLNRNVEVVADKDLANITVNKVSPYTSNIFTAATGNTKVSAQGDKVGESIVIDTKKAEISLCSDTLKVVDKPNTEMTSDDQTSSSTQKQTATAKASDRVQVVSESQEERAEAIEEIFVKEKAVGRTGHDDRLIEEWKKVEAKQSVSLNAPINEGNEETTVDELSQLEDYIVTQTPSEQNRDAKVVKDDIGKKAKVSAEATTISDVNQKKEIRKERISKTKMEPNTSAYETVKIQQLRTAVKHDSNSERVLQKQAPKRERPIVHSSKTKSAESVETKSDEKRSKIEERMKKREERLLQEKREMRLHQKRLATAMRRLVPEEGHDSGVDESTQSRDAGDAPPNVNGRISQKKRQPRSVDPSPMKPRTPQSTASVERKVPMNKIEVGKTASPNIKSVRSKIGSLQNSTYKPGGGNVKIESKKLDFSKASSRLNAKNENYAPGGGDKKIESQKLKWNAASKVGSMDKKDHKAGGGEKKVMTQKVDFKEKAKSKVGSKDNMKHQAGGGNVEIPIEKLSFKEKAASKIGSLDNVKHKAGGGNKKIFDDKEYLKQLQEVSATPSKTSSGRESGAISPATTGTNSPGPQEENEASQDQSQE